MSEELLNIFAGAADGLERTSGNLMNIMIAKHGLDQKNQLFDIQKKRGELDLKEAEFNTDPDILAARREKFMLETKLGKMNLEKAGLEIKEAESKIKKEQQQYETQMKVVLPILQKAMAGGGALPPGFTLKSDGSFSITGGPVRKDAGASLEDLLSEAPPSSKETPPSEDGYTAEEEQLIQSNMEYHNKTREEVIDALKSKGILNG